MHLTPIDWAIIAILAMIAILVICATAGRAPFIKELLTAAALAVFGWYLIHGIIFH